MSGNPDPVADVATASAHIPPPTVMPVDREAWGRRLELCNFINAYYQFRDVQLCDGVRRILVVGPGQGLDTAVFRWRGYDVTTFDIDETFRPDVLGSVHHMSMFGDADFDAVIVSHVLEHMALPYLDPALKEIARVGRHAIIYLPVAGRHMQARVIPGVRGIDVSIELDLYNYLHRPEGTKARYCGGQHFWEVGMRGFHVRDLMRRFVTWFAPIKVYRNRDWVPSQNFVLRSRQHADAGSR